MSLWSQSPAVFRRLTFNCCPVNGASGAQRRSISTTQHVVNALTPLSRCPSRCPLARSCDTLVNELFWISSWSSGRSSLKRLCRRDSRSATDMALPARHERGSLNFRRMLCSVWPSACTSVAPEGACRVRAGMMVKVSRLYVSLMMLKYEKTSSIVLQLFRGEALLHS